jgi:hypothetical protein
MVVECLQLLLVELVEMVDHLPEDTLQVVEVFFLLDSVQVTLKAEDHFYLVLQLLLEITLELFLVTTSVVMAASVAVLLLTVTAQVSLAAAADTLEVQALV